MDVAIKACDPIRLVAIRHVGPYMEIGEAFGRMGMYATTHRLWGPGVFMVGVYHDDPCTVDEAELRADAGVMLLTDHAPEGGTHIVDIEGGPHATGVHEGHYRTLGDTYKAIMDWIGEQGRKVASRPSYEIYLNTPMNTREEDLRTEVRVPVE